MKLAYRGSAKYMKGLSVVEVVGEHNIGSNFTLYIFYVGEDMYCVSKKLVDNNKTWGIFNED